MASFDPIELQRSLGGVDYPASKDELTRHAEESGADDWVIDMLDQLPDRDYDTPADVSEEAARVAE